MSSRVDRKTRLKTHEGIRYGRLLVGPLVERDPATNNHIYSMTCDCGRTVLKRIRPVAYQQTTISCGCAQRQTLIARNTTHGMSRKFPEEYRVWKWMRRRCNSPKSPDFKDYGGRGIKVSSEWGDFARFIADMGPRPPGGTIERINVNGDYCAANCRWATQREQANNKRTNRLIAYMGEVLTLQQFAERVGLSRSRLAYRLNKGMSPEAAASHDDLRKPRGLPEVG